MKYILINNPTDYDKITEFLPGFKVSTDNDTKGVLFLGDNPQPYDNYSLRQILNEHNISFSPIVKCKHCTHYSNNFYEVNSYHNNYYVCNDCTENYDYCDCCNNYFDSTIDKYYAHNGDTICQWCREDNYFTCPGCDELYHVDEGYYNDDDDCYYCSDCYNNHPQHLLYDYHEFRDWQPHHTNPDTPPEFYIGHELEIDNGDNMSTAVETIKNLCNGICMHDGSLTSRGIEFISHPLSYEYMLSQEENYRKCFDKLISLNYKSHNTSTCGLHFHVTRPENSQVIDRIILFMETYKEEIIKLSRRQSAELNRWSRFLSDARRINNDKIIKSLDYIVKNKVTNDRYMALNLTNQKTIEFRLFKGTLKYETFMADFEFVNNLVHFASNLELPIEELTWTLVTSKGKFLPAYIEEHSLKSDTPIVDHSKELVIEFNKEKEEVRIKTDNLIKEILKRIANKSRTKNNTAQKLKDTYRYISALNSNLSDLQYILFHLENDDMFNCDLASLRTQLTYIEGGLK